MLSAFERCVAALPPDQRFMVEAGWLHRDAKTGPTRALLLPAAGGTPRIVSLHQGQHPAVTESAELRRNAFLRLASSMPFGHVLLRCSEAELLVTRDVLLPFDEDRARSLLGFQPQGTVMFLGDRGDL